MLDKENIKWSNQIYVANIRTINLSIEKIIFQRFK